MADVLALPDGFNPDHYWDCDIRELGDIPPPEWIIPDLLPVGFGIIYSAPGVGKSMLAQQITHHLAYGRPLGDWDTQAEKGVQTVHTPGSVPVLVIDLEQDWAGTRERGYAITPFGELTQDGRGFGNRTDTMIEVQHTAIPPRVAPEWYADPRWKTPGHANMACLEQKLADLEADGSLPRLVVIDTLERFLPGKPKGDNAYVWESETRGCLNRIALRFGVCILALHHENKAGEQSGSTGNSGSVEFIYRLERFQDEETGVVTGLLSSSKIRRGAPCRYPMVQSPHDGLWLFDSQSAAGGVVNVGMKKTICEALKQRPMNNHELAVNTGIDAPSLRQVCSRLARARIIEKSFGRWQLVDGWGPQRPGGGTPPPAPEPAPAAPEPAPAPSGDDLEDVAEPEQRSGFEMLGASLDRSRMHPVRRIPKTERDSEPWTLVTEQMSGEHRWTRHLPEPSDDTTVVTLDRNGSYPSAAGSVPLVANLLHHTGEMTNVPRDVGGLFEINSFCWGEDGIGHPLGKIAEDFTPTWWITTPHLRLLQKLWLAGRVPPPEVLDSWTGKATGGLLTAFSKDVQAARNSALVAIADGVPGAEDRYAEVKRSSSVALRCLWPKSARSPFWRPDWSVSVRAEASVRHWIRADQARQNGAVLLRLGTVDEVAIARPAGRLVLVPPPYQIGTTYGKVKIKSQQPYCEWVADRGNRAR